jgi:hypothetical protein
VILSSSGLARAGERGKLTKGGKKVGAKMMRFWSFRKLLRVFISGAVMRSGHIQAEVSRIWAAGDRGSFYSHSCELRFAEKLDCIPERSSKSALSASAAAPASAEGCRESQGVPAWGNALTSIN